MDVKTLLIDAKDLVLIIALHEVGKVVPVIDKRHPLGETAEALRYLGEGNVRGKVVITLDRDTPRLQRSTIGFRRRKAYATF